MKSLVTLYIRPWNEFTFSNREDWYIDREVGLSYVSELEGEEAAEEVFHLTNAPQDMLTESQQQLLLELNFKGPSMSVGDVARVESYPKKHSTPAEYYLCQSFGWKKYEGNVVNLIKHLNW